MFSHGRKKVARWSLERLMERVAAEKKGSGVGKNRTQPLEGSAERVLADIKKKKSPDTINMQPVALQHTVHIEGPEITTGRLKKRLKHLSKGFLEEKEKCPL